MSTSNIDALKNLMALIKESPTLVEELVKAQTPEELTSNLESGVKEADEAGRKQRVLNGITKRVHSNVDAEKTLTRVDGFTQFFMKSFKVKEETPLSRRWNVTITNGDYKITVAIHQSKAHEVPETTPEAE